MKTNNDPTNSSVLARWSANDLAKLEAKFSLYKFGPEWKPKPPRPISPLLRQGKFASTKRRDVLITVAFGVFCLAAGVLPLIGIGGQFIDFSIFALLAGFVFIAFGVGVFFYRQVVNNPLRYVRDGIPLSAFVVDIVMEPVDYHKGIPYNYTFKTQLLYKHPVDGKWDTTYCQSETISANSKDHYTTSFRVGDIVTMVYLPTDPLGTLALYEFLNIRPDIGIVARIDNDSKFKAVIVPRLLTILAVVVFVWNLIAFINYKSIEIPIIDGIVQGVVGAVFLGGVLLFILNWLARNERKRATVRNQKALKSGDVIESAEDRIGWFYNHVTLKTDLLVLLSTLVVGAVTFHCWLLTANVLLDKSTANVTPITIVRVDKKNVDFVIDGEKKTYHTMASEEQAKFLQPGPATAHLHSGFFRWRWVEKFGAPHAR